MCCEKYLKDSKFKSLHLVQKNMLRYYFVFGNYQFLKVHSFFELLS